MCLYTEINLMKLYFVLPVIFASAYYSYAEEDQTTSPIKAMIVREIMKKVSNITLNSLANVPDDKKILVLNKIELKLSKTAESLTDGQKYVHFIMEEFRKKAFSNQKPNESSANAKRINYVNTDNLRASKNIVDLPVVEKPEISRKIFDNQTKERLISEIASKIEMVAKGYLRASQTMEQKEIILQKIKDRIVETSNRKHMQIHNQHNELKAYSDLISKGFELSMRRLLNTNNRRSNSNTPDISAINTELILPEGLNITFTPDSTIMDHVNAYKAFFSEVWKESSIDPRCDEITEEICLRLGALHKLSCGDGQVISLVQLCDGVSDCWNEGDETNCTNQAIDKIQKAMSVMTEIDETMPGKCLQSIAEHDILSYHNKLLRVMLEDKIKYLVKYTPPNTDLIPVDHEFDTIFIKNSITDVRKAISTLSYAFEANLCISHAGTIKRFNSSRRLFNYDALESPEGTPSWSPKTCTCKNKYCKTEKCDPRCERICYQKHSLNHWECTAIGGDTFISLDLICDGKLDCYDESDETSCTTVSSYTKYEANNLYKDLLDILSLKSLSMEYGHSRNKIAAQLTVVRQLQKLTTKSYADVHAIKLLRDEFFKLLVQIYVDLMQTSNLVELEHSYDFLFMISQKMVAALKLSHSGNESHLSPAGCYCYNGTCAIVRCSKKCIATCEIEPMITKYYCSADNTSVHIKAVCNGKKDCPSEEDEKDCSVDVCRSHHLFLLRHNLQKAGMSQRGTVLGETLDKWKARVMASLTIAQNNERPNHKMIEDLIIKILRDLVTSYASVEETRRINTNVTIGEFRNVSDIVKQTLKSCGN